MRTTNNRITLYITFYEGDYEVGLVMETPRNNFETEIGKFDELHEARAFCKAFEDACNDVAIIEDLTDAPREEVA